MGRPPRPPSPCRKNQSLKGASHLLAQRCVRKRGDVWAYQMVLVKIRKLEKYKTMPWKNGGGITKEMAIEPLTAKFPQDDFLWRLSSAEIQSKNSFSNFPGYDRILFVINGAGLSLYEKSLDDNQSLKKVDLKPLHPFLFQGETLIECELLANTPDRNTQPNNQVVDLGLIFKRNHIKADAKVFSFSETNQTYDMPLHEGTNLLVCTAGRFQTQGHVVGPLETLEILGATNITLQIFEPCTAINFRLFR